MYALMNRGTVALSNSARWYGAPRPDFQRYDQEIFREKVGRLFKNPQGKTVAEQHLEAKLAQHLSSTKVESKWVGVIRELKEQAYGPDREVKAAALAALIRLSRDTSFWLHNDDRGHVSQIVDSLNNEHAFIDLDPRRFSDINVTGLHIGGKPSPATRVE